MALAAFLAYAGTLRFALVYDDAILVDARNEHLHEPARVVETFTTPFFRSVANDIDVYRPVTALSVAATWRLNELFGGEGSEPFLFHLGNVLANALAGVAALFALRSVFASPFAALAASLVWVLHPLHTEAVANVYGRSEVLAALFGFAFLALHRSDRRIASGVALFLALASKESAVGFAPLALAIDALVPRGGRRFHALAWIGPALAFTVFFALRAHALEGVVARPMVLENPLATASALERVLTAAHVQALYLQLSVWCTGFSSDYSFDQIPIVRSLADPRVIAFALVVVTAVALALVFRRKRPEIAVGVLAWALLFAVTSNFLFPIGTIAGERLAYAPSIGVAILVGVAFERLASARGTRFASLVLAPIALTLGALTAVRSEVWKDEFTLFRDQVATAPRSAKAHLNLGTVLQRAGDDEGAIQALRASLAIHAQNSQTWYVLGNALYNVRAEPKVVIEAFLKALEHGPAHHDARAKLAIVFAKCGLKDDARRVLGELQQVAPNHPLLPQIRQLVGAR